MLHRIYWSTWLGGTALILLSWADVVSPAVGWAGFAIACLAAFLSYIPRGSRRGQTDDWAVLTKAMLDSKDRGYDAAMERLRRGGTVFYDGMAFAVCPGNGLSLVVVASLPIAELDEVRVQREVEQAKAGFEALTRLSPEVAGMASEKTQRVSLISEYGANGFEICRVVDGRIEWKVKGKRPEQIA